MFFYLQEDVFIGTIRVNISQMEGNAMDIQLGDIITLKKEHPCGSKEWEVLRVGMDFRLKCMGCARQVMIPRKQLEKSVKKIMPKVENNEE